MRKYTKKTEIGKIYGFLEIVDFIEAKTIKGKETRSIALVKCLKCNSEIIKEIRHKSLVSGEIKSCCAKIIHGLYYHPYYNNCKGAIRRCKPTYFKSCNYYDRGIRCDWTIDTIADFIHYLEDNLPPRKENESLDRINNDGNYAPGNLRWATKEEQNNNKRRPIKNNQYDKLKEENDKLKQLLKDNNIKLP